jgi:hypothetical protein
MFFAAARAASNKLQQSRAGPLCGLTSPTGSDSPTVWAPVWAYAGCSDMYERVENDVKLSNAKNRPAKSG